MDNRTIAAIDVGQATTQAALFTTVGLDLQLVGVTSVPTPRGPRADLALGIRRVLVNLQTATGFSLLSDDGERALAASSDGVGPDEWLLTADAGGPVRVAVAGVIDDISGQSALRAALIAGAAVADLFAINDGRPEHHKARDLRNNPVDMILIAGGVDEGLFAGGGGRQVLNIAQTVAMASPRPRYDPRGRATVVFAGSADARPEVSDRLAACTNLIFADNVRPDLHLENLAGARQAVVDVFRHQVMPADSRWQGVAAFAGRTGLLPTGMACLHATELLAAGTKRDVIIVDVGESVLNVYSSIAHELNRTVTDEAGLNFDCPGALVDLANASLTWLPQDLTVDEVGDVLATQRRRPASLPLTWSELMVRQAADRERIRAALDGHRKVAALLKGIHRQRNVDEVLGTYFAVGGQTIVDLATIGVVLATGRQVATATTPGQVLGMVLDGVQPQGVTQILSDSAGLLPHLGAMATLDEALAAQIIGDNWFDQIGLVVAPVPRERGGPVFRRQGASIATVRIERADGTQMRETVDYGVLKRIPLASGEVVRVTVTPDRAHNAGGGFGATTRMSGGGSVGIILDGRGRPVIMPQNPARRKAKVAEWLRVIDAYPDDVLAITAAGEAM
jgi:hypothetical protein